MKREEVHLSCLLQTALLFAFGFFFACFLLSADFSQIIMPPACPFRMFVRS